MKYTLEIPDDEAGTIIEAIRRLSAAIKLTPVGRANGATARAQAETDYLLSTPANARELMESIAQADRGEIVHHPTLPAK